MKTAVSKFVKIPLIHADNMNLSELKRKLELKENDMLKINKCDILQELNKHRDLIDIWLEYIDDRRIFGLNIERLFAFVWIVEQDIGGQGHQWHTKYFFCKKRALSHYLWIYFRKLFL